MNSNPTSDQLEQFRPLPDTSNDPSTELYPEGANGLPIGQQLKDLALKPKSLTPPHLIPFIKTDLHALQAEQPLVVWFGHSSYLVHYRGANILVDPVFSGHSFPFPYTVKAFRGSDAFGVGDLPEIDLLIVTNNHYDHFDKKAISRLKDKTKQFCAPLGVGKYIESCGVDPDRVAELDCWSTIKPLPGASLTATPVQHFSGSGFQRTGMLWSSFVLKLDNYSLYLGGDSGYGAHFRIIGDSFGPFDLAVLECGQYHAAWSSVHMLPEEMVQAGKDLKAKCVLPVHWAKFAMADHPWDEPITRVVEAARAAGVTITTPLIGERVVLDKYYPYMEWWKL
ncbi:MBL fold metallo-hydrolase [Paraflavisolibacter sp. H34]|uniref:MBL fold metallo-hydrolase n=1 Tax=Huijunlia imazamoxiresistens TaxID=3127457 RepID=UPI00301A9158